MMLYSNEEFYANVSILTQIAHIFEIKEVACD